MKERTQLLPKWIKFFSWIFLIFSASPLFLIIGYFLGYMSYSIYGIKFHGSVLQPLSLILTLFLTFHGITAYALLWGKRWAVDAGIACGLIGAISGITSMIIAFIHGNLHFEFSIIFLLIFVNSLFDIRKKWREI